MREVSVVRQNIVSPKAVESSDGESGILKVNRLAIYSKRLENTLGIC